MLLQTRNNYISKGGEGGNRIPVITISKKKKKEGKEKQTITVKRNEKRNPL